MKSIIMNKLRPNEQRAKNAITLIWVVLGFEIVSLISSYFQYNLLQTAVNGGEISPEVANANDLREQIIGIIYLIVYVVSAVTFIQWFRRAYFNLHTKISYLSHTEGWAAGSWFVPIISLYRPSQIMKELYTETEKLLKQNKISFDQSFNTNNSVGVWWAIWVISNILGNFIFRYTSSAESIDELINATIGSMIINIIGIPLALITVKVIKDYSDVEPLLSKIKDEENTIAANKTQYR